MSLLYMGIDPGSSSGAYAFINEDKSHFYSTFFPKNETEVVQKISEILTAGHTIKLAVLEQVHSHPGMGCKSSFTFGANFGFWRGILYSFNIPFSIITPNRWQTAVFDSVKKGQSKELSVQYASRMYPDTGIGRFKKDHNLADAICMANYAWKEDKGIL